MGLHWWELDKNRALCFPEEGKDVGVEQEVLFHEITLQRMHRDSLVSKDDVSSSSDSTCAAVSFL